MSQIRIALTALESLNISDYNNAEAIKLTHGILVTTNLIDVFAWEKLAKGDDQHACHQFVSERAMTVVPAGSVVFANANTTLECISIRVKGSSTIFYIPFSKTDQISLSKLGPCSER
jgi:hypothetical protein